jgi:hypothetical protein
MTVVGPWRLGGSADAGDSRRRHVGAISTWVPLDPTLKGAKDRRVAFLKVLSRRHKKMTLSWMRPEYPRANFYLLANRGAAGGGRQDL